ADVDVDAEDAPADDVVPAPEAAVTDDNDQLFLLVNQAQVQAPHEFLSLPNDFANSSIVCPFLHQPPFNASTNLLARLGSF
ncbi:hypothetical protein HK102_011942, partial [Quaeritorhiza haematococci]